MTPVQIMSLAIRVGEIGAQLEALGDLNEVEADTVHMLFVISEKLKAKARKMEG